jgi:hypothetical protein
MGFSLAEAPTRDVLEFLNLEMNNRKKTLSTADVVRTSINTWQAATAPR